jgi:hypothetical protein
MAPGPVVVDLLPDASYKGAASLWHGRNWAEQCDNFDRTGQCVNLGGRFTCRLPFLKIGVSLVFCQAHPATSPSSSSALVFLMLVFLSPSSPPSLGFAMCLLPLQLSPHAAIPVPQWSHGLALMLTIRTWRASSRRVFSTRG